MNKNFFHNREESPRVLRSVTHSDSPKDLRNPVLLSHIMSQKRRKSKVISDKNLSFYSSQFEISTNFEVLKSKPLSFYFETQTYHKNFLYLKLIRS